MKKYIIQNNSEISKNIKSYATKITACVAFFCCTLFFLAKVSFASDDLLVKHKEKLTRIENYLQNIKNLSADFVQKSDSGYTTGKFFLSRPGKMRVQYNDQPQILIVVNGSVLSYKDLELDEVSRLRTNTTPASFLTRKKISFAAKDVKIVDFSENEEFMSVSVMKKNKQEAGQFKLIFEKSPFNFVKMEVQSELGQVTTISLKNITYPESLRSNLFVIKNKNLPL